MSSRCCGRTGLGSGLVGGLISYAAATLAIALLLAWPGRLRHALAIKREPLKWFTYSGVSVCIAQMFVYMAFTVAPVLVVMPILQLLILSNAATFQVSDTPTYVVDFDRSSLSRGLVTR